MTTLIGKGVALNTTELRLYRFESCVIRFAKDIDVPSTYGVPGTCDILSRFDVHEAKSVYAGDCSPVRDGMRVRLPRWTLENL